jgi:hypothetical protein
VALSPLTARMSTLKDTHAHGPFFVNGPDSLLPLVGIGKPVPATPREETTNTEGGDGGHLGCLSGKEG